MPFPFGHVGPHELLGPFNPFQIIRTPSEQGIPFGIQENGLPFYVDLHYWMTLNLIGGTSVQFLGDRDSGKTAAAQVFAARNSALKAVDGIRRRVSVDDTRRNAGVPEYKAFAEGLGGRHIDLAKYRINFLDPKMGMNATEQHGVIRAMGETISHRELSLNERVALMVGLHVMNIEAANHASPNLLQPIMSTLGLSDYEHYVRSRNDQTLQGIGNAAIQEKLRQRLSGKLNMTANQFRQACESISEMMLLLLEEYGGIFGGTNSLYDILSDPVVALDFTELDDDTIPLVEMLLWMWRNAAVRRHDHNLMAHIELHDENWKRWESLTYGRNMVNHLKKIRGSGAAIIKIMHRPSDVDQVGEIGSRQHSLAMTGLRETDVWFIGKTQHSDFDSLSRFVRLPKRYLDMLPTLGKGDFIVKIGELMSPFRMHLDLMAHERGFTQTNQASRAMAGLN